MANKIDGLLKAVDAVRAEMAEAHARRLASGAEFNVYELCGVSHYELMHSKILAEILNPSGMHGQGVRFLKLFSEEFGLSDFSDATKVALEVKGFIGSKSIGRFDIYLEDKDSVCIIENKVYAGEQEQQLARYRAFLDDEKNFGHISKDKRYLLFLTLDGRDATTLDDGYVKIPYYAEKDPSICSWLERCSKGIGEMISVPLLLYRNHIRELSIGESMMKENVAKCLVGNMEVANLILQNYVIAANQIKQKIMDDVTELLPQEIRGKILSAEDVWSDFNVTRPSRYGESGWGYRVSRNFCQKKGAENWLRVFVTDGHCQVGVFSEDFCSKEVLRRFLRWGKENSEEFKKKDWCVDDRQYPLYYDVLDQTGQSYKFDPPTLDKISKDEFREAMARDITRSLVELYAVMSKFETEFAS